MKRNPRDVERARARWLRPRSFMVIPRAEYDELLAAARRGRSRSWPSLEVDPPR